MNLATIFRIARNRAVGNAPASPASGELWIDGQSVTDSTFAGEVARRRAIDPDVRAVIAADRHVEHGTVVSVIDRVRAAGVTRFAILTEPPPTVGDAGAVP